MEKHANTGSEQPIKEEKSLAKKDYTAPKIIHQAPLEAMAASCLPEPPGKAGGTCTSITS